MYSLSRICQVSKAHLNFHFHRRQWIPFVPIVFDGRARSDECASSRAYLPCSYGLASHAISRNHNELRFQLVQSPGISREWKYFRGNLNDSTTYPWILPCANHLASQLNELCTSNDSERNERVHGVVDFVDGFIIYWKLINFNTVCLQFIVDFCLN